MENTLLSIRIGHQRILDHLILGTAQTCEKNMHLEYASLVPVVSETWDSLCDALLEREIHGAFLPIPMAADLFDAGIDICLLMFVHRSGRLFLQSRTPTTLASLQNSSILLSSEYSVDNMVLHRFFASADFHFDKFQDPDAPGFARQPDVIQEIVPDSIMLQMMTLDEKQDIAGCVMCQPFASRCMDQGLAKMLCTTDDLWQNHPCCGFVLYKDVLERHPLAIEEVLSVFCESAWQLYQLQHGEYSPEIASAAAKFLNQDIPKIQEFLSSSKINFRPDRLIPEQKALDVIVSYMSREIKILPEHTNMDGFIIPEPLNNALKNLRRPIEDLEPGY